MEKSAGGEETQGDHAGGITTVTGVDTDTAGGGEKGVGEPGLE